MDAVLLTWRWQNILSIAIMVAGLFLVYTLIAQVGRRVGGNADAQ